MVSRFITATEIDGSRALRMSVGGSGACIFGILVLTTNGGSVLSHQSWAFVGWTLGAAVTELVASTSRRPRPDDVLAVLGVLIFSALLLLVTEREFLSWMLLIACAAILARIITWILGCPRWQAGRTQGIRESGYAQFSLQALVGVTFLIALLLVIGPKLGFHQRNVERIGFLFAPIAVLWFVGMIAAVWRGRRRACLMVFTGAELLAVCYAIGFSDTVFDAAGPWLRSHWGQSIVGPLASAVAAGSLHYLSRVDRGAAQHQSL